MSSTESTSTAPNTVMANGIYISHMNSGGFEQSSAPDVCLTPSGSAMVPVPYIIVSDNTTLKNGTSTVTADGGYVIDIKGSFHETCSGDEGGTGNGIISGTILKKSEWITYSPNVFIEGKPVCRLADKLLMNNKNTVSAHGHVEPTAPLSKLEKILCEIFCEAKKEWQTCKDRGKSDCKRPSQLAEKKAKSSRFKNRLNNTIARHKGPGFTGSVEKRYFAKLSDKLAKKAEAVGRKVYSVEKVRQRIINRVRNKILKKVGEKAVKKAATAWIKLIPGLNIISTVIDIVDLAVTGVEFAQMITEALDSLSGPGAVEIKPDFAIEGPDGAIDEIYDFKFDDEVTKYQDDWGPQQQQIYQEASGKKPQKIDQDRCNCAPTGGRSR